MWKQVMPMLLGLCLSASAAGRIVIMSDSTAVDYRGKKNVIAKTAAWEPMAGWGTYTALALRPGVEIFNRSSGGLSSKTYYENVLPKASICFCKGGWLLLSFGSNDARPHPKFNRATDPKTTFPEYMGKIADAAKKAGMRIVVISPLPICTFVKGKWDNSLFAPYAEASKKFAADNGYYFIDAFQLVTAALKDKSQAEIQSYYMFLEPGVSPNWPKGRRDPLHYRDKGAELVWKLIRQAIAKDIPELDKLFQPLPKENAK